jgi:molybdopterin molybdotransferase
MISVLDAENIIVKNTTLFPKQLLPLCDAAGEVLREIIYSDRDQPPFDRVTMDGLAISFQAWEGGGAFFRVEAMGMAGEVQKILRDSKNAIEVMTGAVLPEGCDSVVPYEDLDKKEDGFVIRPEVRMRLGQNVHRRGSDVKAGEMLQKEGILNGPRLGVLASAGKTHVWVSSRPRIAVLSTGDELVDLDQEIKPFQIRKSNPYAIQAILKSRGYSQVQFFHARDNKKDLWNKICTAMSKNDFLICSGGVSMGAADFVPDILKELKVSILFHKVAQKPGKPMLFGRTVQGQSVFGLPGNPVSVLVCLVRYVLPALDQGLGIVRKTKRVQMEEDFQNRVSHLTAFTTGRFGSAERTSFIPARLESGLATLCPVNTSGDFSSLAKSDGFVEMQAGKTSFLKGEFVPFFSWGVS